MDHVVFVPISDELLFEHPELIRGPLVPYNPGMAIGVEQVNEPVESPRIAGPQTKRIVRKDRRGARD